MLKYKNNYINSCLNINIFISLQCKTINIKNMKKLVIAIIVTLLVFIGYMFQCDSIETAITCTLMMSPLGCFVVISFLEGII